MCAGYSMLNAIAMSIVSSESITEAPAVEAAEGLGKRLRSVRRQRNQTLGEVAEATDISKSFLSLVESGKSDITIGRLMRLVRFYGISVTDLLPDDDDGGTVAIVRAGHQKVVASPSEGIEDFLLTPDTKRVMLPVLAVFAPGGRNVEPAEHEGDEFAHVLDGRITVSIEGGEPVTLKRGDSIYFRADLPHAYANPTKHPARVLFVITPPHL
jgi:quercetin dioxygenase-like cupin family protein/DNA-binding Xre family transcriptional regulator